MIALIADRAAADAATGHTVQVLADPQASEADRQAALEAEKITLETFQASSPADARALDAEMAQAETTPEAAPDFMLWSGPAEAQAELELEAG